MNEYVQRLAPALILSVLLFCPELSRAQVTILRTQFDVDSFDATEVQGDLIIDGGFFRRIFNLQGLSELQVVTGNFEIRSTRIDNLEGLASLQSCAALVISQNSELQNIDGLSGLNNVTGDIAINSNAQLSDFCGLYTLFATGTFGGAFSVSNNQSNPSQDEILRDCAPDFAIILPEQPTVLEDGSIQIEGILVKAESRSIRMSISLENGFLSLAQVAGLAFSEGDGEADMKMVFSGALDAVNSALKVVTYSPAPDFNGEETMGIAAASEESDQAAQATLNLVVQAVNDPPVIIAQDTVKADRNSETLFGPVEVNDIDAGSGQITVSFSALYGRLTLATTNQLTFTRGNGIRDRRMIFQGQLSAVNAALDQITYLAANNFPDDILTITVNDNGNTGSEAGLTAEHSIAVVFQGIELIDDNATTREDTPVSIAVLQNDQWQDGSNSVQIGALPPGSGTAEVQDDRTILYTPEANFFGSDAFRYFVTTGLGNSDTATVVIEVTPENDTPVAVDDTLTVPWNSASEINPLANDFDVDGDAIRIVGVDAASEGRISISSDSTLRYEPAPEFEGVATATYRIADDNGSQATGTITIFVFQTNAAPVLSHMPDLSFPEDDSRMLNLRDYVTDPNGEEEFLSWQIAILSTGSPGQSVSLLIEISDGIATFSGAPDYFTETPVPVEITATDRGGLSDSDTINVTISPVNDAPVGITRLTPLDNLFYTPGQIFFLWQSGSDPDGDAVQYRFDLTVGNTDTSIALSDTALVLDFGLFELEETIITVTWTVMTTDGTDWTEPQNGVGTFRVNGSATGIAEDAALPADFMLHPNYPNPFNPTTTLLYELPERSQITLAIYDIRGRMIRLLKSDSEEGGRHQMAWDARDAQGIPVGSGIYFVTLRALGQSGKTALFTRKMTLLK